MTVGPIPSEAHWHGPANQIEKRAVRENVTNRLIVHPTEDTLWVYLHSKQEHSILCEEPVLYGQPSYKRAFRDIEFPPYHIQPLELK